MNKFQLFCLRRVYPVLSLYTMGGGFLMGSCWRGWPYLISGLIVFGIGIYSISCAHRYRILRAKGLI